MERKIRLVQSAVGRADEEAHAIAGAWNQLAEKTKRSILPTIVTRAAFQMSVKEITLDLVEGEAKIIDEAIEVECE